MMATSAIASLPKLPPVRRGGHCIEENVVPTSKFPRGVLAINNSRSFSCTQFPLGRRTRSQAATLNICCSFVRRGGHCIEENVVPTSKFPRVNNSRSFSCTQFPIGRRTRSQAATIICAAAFNARCSAEQTQTITREAPTITHLPGKEKSPQLDDGGSGFPPRDDDDGGGGGGGGGNWSGGFFFFGFLAFLGFLKDKESDDDGYAYSDNRRRG